MTERWIRSVGAFSPRSHLCNAPAGLGSLPGSLVLAAILVPALTGCATVPDYERPEVPAPQAYREGAPWKEAAPADELAKGPWWEIFEDDDLSAIVDRVQTANPDLAAAAARIEQARAAAGISGADRWPRVTLDPSAVRSRTADDLSSTGSGQITTTLRAPVDMSYEVDLFGRVKQSVMAARSDLGAARADYENLLLSLQAEAVRGYFSLRTLDAEIELLTRTLGLRRRSFELVRTLYENGQVSRLDLAHAEVELASGRADLAVLERSRASAEHALAVLVGQPPSAFVIPSRPLDLEGPVPVVSPGLPSSLLERRPDIAAAERRLMAANSRIGIARAAFFPSLSLTGSAGFASDDLGSLFTWGNSAWALGPFLSLPLFDGGRNRAAAEQAQARWDEAVAVYRKQVLTAFSEVEDALSDIRLLTEQFEALQQAVTSAQDAADLTDKRYRAGRVSYLEVVVSERTALSAQVLAVRAVGQRLQASITLIKALGGGWGTEQQQTLP